MNYEEIALRILKEIDYDMWKEAINEPEEWSFSLNEIEGILEEVYEEGYDAGWKVGNAS